MKKSCLLCLLGLACVLSFATPGTVWAGRNVLTISNHTGADIDIESVTCDGQAFGFGATTLTNNSGTSEASELLQSGSVIEVKGTFHLVDPPPMGRQTGVLDCSVPLHLGASCSSGVRTGSVSKITTPDFDAWRIDFK